MKNFDKWNLQKKLINKKQHKVFFKQRDIFFIKLGKNVGHEQDGKGDHFIRPVIVLKKFNNNLFIGVPLTSNLSKEGKFYFNFVIKKSNKENKAILSQLKLIDSKRLINKIGMISKKDFNSLKRKVGHLLEITD